MTLKGFFKECHKKEVFKMLSIYIVSSWVLLQVLALLVEPLGLPIKSVTILIVVLLIGFPIYIYYVWKFRLLKYEIQQTEDPTTPYNKSAFQKMYFSSLFVVTLISGIAVTIIIKNNFNSSGLKLNAIDVKNKIAVLDFENTTGNNDLDHIGEIAANWIIHGITENEVAEVISSKIVDDYTSVLKTQAGSANLNNLLKNYLKPEKIIEGMFYMEKGKLLLQGSIKNGLLDQTLISFETVECDPDSPLDCAEELKQNILGYLSTEGKTNESGYIQLENRKTSYYEEKPPKYEAFKYMINALDVNNDDENHLKLLQKAVEIDSSFLEPKFHIMAYYYNKGAFAKTDSLMKTVSNNLNLNRRQKNWLLFYQSIINGKYDKLYKAIMREYEDASLDLTTNQTTMTIALQYVNKPEDIKAIYDVIPMEDMVIENCEECEYRYYLKGLADVELKNYNSTIETLLPITNTIDANYLKRPLISAYVKADRLNELDAYLSEFGLSASIDDINYLYIYTGMQLLNASRSEEAQNYFEKVISSKNSASNKRYIALAYYYNKDYTNAETLLAGMVKNDPKNIEFLVHLAISYYNNDKEEQAIQLIEQLNDIRAEYQYGAVDYGIAQYYATTNDQRKALEYILKSIVQGNYFTPTSYHHDPHFNQIKQHPVFKGHLNYWKNKLL
ncbi:MAG: hypothetical protein HKM26_09750 [Winogradskyella sp.]|nr:hypothetical protein [Winogradskyella sp.]